MGIFTANAAAIAFREDFCAFFTKTLLECEEIVCENGQIA